MNGYVGASWGWSCAGRKQFLLIHAASRQGMQLRHRAEMAGELLPSSARGPGKTRARQAQFGAGSTSADGASVQRGPPMPTPCPVSQNIVMPPTCSCKRDRSTILSGVWGHSQDKSLAHTVSQQAASAVSAPTPSLVHVFAILLPRASLFIGKCPRMARRRGMDRSLARGSGHLVAVRVVFFK